MSNTFNIKNTRGTIIATIFETDKNTNSTSLVLHGRGAKEYGFDRDQNLVFMLENFSSITAPSNPIIGQLWWKFGDELFVRTSVGSPESPATGSPWTSIVPPTETVGFKVIGGAGFGSPQDGSPAGFPTGSPLTVTLNLAEGSPTSITVTANAISTNDAKINHDSLSGFVANEHIDHASVSITPGTGMIGTGPNNITASGSISVVGGDGLTVGGQTVSVDSTVVRTSGSQTLGGIKTFTTTIRAPDGTAALPGFAFAGDTNTGMYFGSPIGQLNFTTGGIQKFQIESDGTLHSTISNYETLVTENQDIPNKKYVDDNAPVGGTPTENTHVGVGSVSGLTIGKKYLVHCYGIGVGRGTGGATLGGVRLTQGTTSGSGTFIVATPSISINWPDGPPQQGSTFIVTAPSTSIAGAMDYVSAFSFVIPMYMTAVQLS